MPAAPAASRATCADPTPGDNAGGVTGRRHRDEWSVGAAERVRVALAIGPGGAFLQQRRDETVDGVGFFDGLGLVARVRDRRVGRSLR